MKKIKKILEWIAIAMIYIIASVVCLFILMSMFALLIKFSDLVGSLYF